MKKIIVGFLVLSGLSVAAMAAPHAFPVPYVAKDSVDKQIHFTELSWPGTIRIATIDGDEVRKLDIEVGDNIKHWDVKNASGKDVATGIYLYFIDTPNLNETGKLVIIR